MRSNHFSKIFCATVLYPYHEGKDFDFEYYSKVLIPEYVNILGNNCLKYEIRKGLSSPGNPHVQFICIANFWIKSAEQFGVVMSSPQMKNMMRQIAAFTEIQPIRQFDEVIGEEEFN